MSSIQLALKQSAGLPEAVVFGPKSRQVGRNSLQPGGLFNRGKNVKISHMTEKSMNFIKLQGVGNDFVLIDGRELDLTGVDLKNLSIEICDRHFGVGADGLLLVLPSEKANYRMRIFNPDGSEPEMCGNGIRCFAKYVYEKDKLKCDVISVETLAGIIVPAIIEEGGVVSGIEVDMGIPKKTGKFVIGTFDISAISMGNPHAVIFADDLSAINLPEVGPLIENHANFPNRTNVEFVKVISKTEIEIIVWERGAGVTLACGTGACASVVAANLAGLTGRKVLVHLPGGDLNIEWQESDDHVLMSGPAEAVFTGQWPLR
jgi:diaminopimelate epimerase